MKAIDAIVLGMFDAAAAATNTSTAFLPELQSLDVGDMTVSRVAVEKIVKKLTDGSIFPRLCRLRLRVRPAYSKQKASDMLRRLKNARATLRVELC